MPGTLLGAPGIQRLTLPPEALDLNGENDTSQSCNTGLPRWHLCKESSCRCKRHGLYLWVGKIPWRKKWQPTPVFLPGKPHGQRSLAGYRPWGPMQPLTRGSHEDEGEGDSSASQGAGHRPSVLTPSFPQVLKAGWSWDLPSAVFYFLNKCLLIGSFVCLFVYF